MNFRDENDRLKPLSVFSHSSLTDIVFLLLVFFLLTSSFVVNYGIKVNIPKAESGSPKQSQYITVTITKSKKYYVGGKLTSPGLLASAIRKEYQKNPRSTLVLRADKEAIVDDAVKVMNIAKALNLKVVLATERANR
ncbi:MAG TPA: biopolymer transporter ExbD [Balneolales bacterium]|nr:biopolymer transporter ExbD [Balneolales bacterium]